MTVVLAVLMAVGNHFMAFTKLCFNVLPLYNKFRTVSMALVLLQLALPLLGFLTLSQILSDADRRPYRKGLLWAFALTGGFCLLFTLFPGLAGDFTAASDASQQDILVDAFRADRRMLLRQDALGSLLWISGAFALLWWATTSRAAAGKNVWVAAALGLLVTVNLFSTGKRYLNASHFTTPKDFDKPFAERPVDRLIKSDPDPSYRVLDLTVNVFNSSVPSYHHKSVGGYSPAKLQRYQDLIEKYLTGEINAIYRSLQRVQTVGEAEAALPETPLLDALNTRYLILDGSAAPVRNASALGAAWLVDETVPAATADEELALLGGVDLGRQAVIGPDFADALPSASPAAEGAEDAIRLVSYAPNCLRYHYRAASPRLAVFSEIYYPKGWKAWVETPQGQEELPLLRADWTLRAAALPEGEGDIVMRFDPEVYRTGAAISRASSGLLLLLVLLSLVGFCLPATAAGSSGK